MRIRDWSSDVCSSDLIHEPVNGALISRRTLLFDLASLAGGRSVTDRPISGMLALGIHGFTSRAADRVGLLVMDELHGAEVLRAHGPALDRRCHADTVLFATRHFLRVRVASVRQHFELVDVEHFFCRYRHWMKQLDRKSVV